MQTLELIDKYIDNELTQPQTQQLEANLEHDADLQQLLDSVVIARGAVRLQAITVKVKGLHNQYIDEVRAASREDNVRIMPVSRAYSWVARIAATALIGIVGYQYVSLDNSSLYQAKFISYQLPTTRGTEEKTSSLNTLYLSGNYKAVIRQFNTLSKKSPSDYFLTGVAHLQQKEYESALVNFNALRQYNKQHTDRYFGQETDYYMALAYLGAGRIEDAYGLFKTIHDTPRHLFNESVTTLDLVKLNLLRSKM